MPEQDQTSPPVPHDPQQARRPRPRTRLDAAQEADLSGAVMDRVFALGDRVTRVEADVGHALEAVAGLRGEVHEVRTSTQAIKDHLEAQDRAYVEHDRARAGSLEATRTHVETLEQVVQDGFARLAARLDAGLPQLDFVEGLIAHAERRRSRRVRWASWLDELFGLARYALAAVLVTVAGFAFTHPVGRLPDPEVLPYTGLIGVLLLAAVAWTTYRKVHHEPPEVPESPEAEHAPRPHGK